MSEYRVMLFDGANYYDKGYKSGLTRFKKNGKVVLIQPSNLEPELRNLGICNNVRLWELPEYIDDCAEKEVYKGTRIWDDEWSRRTDVNATITYNEKNGGQISVDRKLDSKSGNMANASGLMNNYWSFIADKNCPDINNLLGATLKNNEKVLSIEGYSHRYKRKMRFNWVKIIQTLSDDRLEDRMPRNGADRYKDKEIVFYLLFHERELIHIQVDEFYFYHKTDGLFESIIDIDTDRLFRYSLSLFDRHEINKKLSSQKFTFSIQYSRSKNDTCDWYNVRPEFKYHPMGSDEPLLCDICYLRFYSYEEVEEGVKSFTSRIKAMVSRAYEVNQILISCFNHSKAEM